MHGAAEPAHLISLMFTFITTPHNGAEVCGSVRMLLSQATMSIFTTIQQPVTEEVFDCTHRGLHSPTAISTVT